MFDLKKQLNPAQFAAAATINGPVLVIAGAGSGKTRVIEYRVLNLVQNKINPSSILLLTFTRKAAREMLSRAARHNCGCKDVEGGTFHSFGLKMLRRHCRLLGLSGSFSVLDEADSQDAVHRCCAKAGLFTKEKRFPRKDTLSSIISKSTNKKVSVNEVLKREFPHFLQYAGDIEKVRKAYAKYKKNKNYLDFDDLLVYLGILLGEEEIQRRISKRYRYVMVDEYQDTNPLQGDITYLLAKGHRNVMVVGDDAQSIYGFRGASHKNIMAFPQMFPECKIIKLEQNYRSTQSILNVSNSALENMENKYSKCLVSARKISGVRPHLLFFKDAYSEAECIAGRIKQFRDEGVALEHQAVLFRSAYISIPLQTELSRRNIPYQVFGGLKFYETAHTRDMLAHLKVIANPKDELAWHRVLMLLQGVGPKTSERITDEIIASSGLNDIIKGVLPKYKKGCKFSGRLARLRSVLQAASGKKRAPAEQFEVVLKYYRPTLRDRFDNWPLRLNDLQTLRQVATRYDSLEELLADLAIEPPERGVARVEFSMPEQERPLTLSTIHSAKGLEWNSVFLIGVMDGVLPVSFALGDEDEVEEEHRLFYVGLTRARNRLFLSMHHQGNRGGISRFNQLSRFVDAPNVLSKIETDGLFEEEWNRNIGIETLSKSFGTVSYLQSGQCLDG